MDTSKTFAEALQGLVGEQLSSVEFVQDYVQLRFNGPCLTVYSSAQQIDMNGVSLMWGRPGYRDTLCSLITHIVKEAKTIPSTSLSLVFDDNSAWQVSLRESDYEGPEALMFNDEMTKRCFVL